jgi:hypothetical protein
MSTCCAYMVVSCAAGYWYSTDSSRVTHATCREIVKDIRCQELNT